MERAGDQYRDSDGAVNPAAPRSRPIRTPSASAGSIGAWSGSDTTHPNRERQQPDNLSRTREEESDRYILRPDGERKPRPPSGRKDPASPRLTQPAAPLTMASVSALLVRSAAGGLFRTQDSQEGIPAKVGPRIRRRRTRTSSLRKEHRMPEKLKQKIMEFVALAKDCPENLQEKCFELLLAHHLQHLRPKAPSEREDPNPPKPTGDEDKKEGEDKKTPQQEDIAETDLHVKARQFLKKSGLTVEHINQLFYKQEGSFLPLYDDLKTTKTSESQIRIALLHSLLEGMRTGDFAFNGESVREEAQVRKCYDSPNFAAHFKNSKELFDGFSKYNKTSPTIKLSADGKARLAEVIKDLQ